MNRKVSDLEEVVHGVLPDVIDGLKDAIRTIGKRLRRAIDAVNGKVDMLRAEVVLLQERCEDIETRVADQEAGAL